MAKKIAGQDRPYTIAEFFSIVSNLVEQSVPLDYFNPSSLDKTLQNDDFIIVSETTFGGNEGIYSDFYLRFGGERIDFATAKTLLEGDENFIAMHVFAAKFALVANRYIREHDEEFNWSGFNVYTEKDGKLVHQWWCGKIENAQRAASELKKRGEKTQIRDNSTRKFVD